MGWAARRRLSRNCTKARKPERRGPAAAMIGIRATAEPPERDVNTDASFEWRRIFNGREVDDTRAYLRAGFGRDVRFDLARARDRRIEVRSEGVDLPNMFIHHARLGTGFAIEGRHPDPHYVVFLPLSGRIQANARK